MNHKNQMQMQMRTLYTTVHVKYYRTHKLYRLPNINEYILWKTIGRVKCGHLVERKRKRSNDPLLWTKNLKRRRNTAMSMCTTKGMRVYVHVI